MDISQAISVALVFCLCKGETQKDTGPILLSNGINASEVVSSRQAGYGLVRFDGPVDHYGEPGRPTQASPFASDSPNNRPLKFEDDNTSYTTQNNLDPSAEAHNIVSFKDDTDYNTNQISSQKKRRRRRRRKTRRLVTDIRFGPGGQPILPSQPTGQSFQQKPNLKEMSGPLRAISDALGSIIQNDTKHCVKRMLCEQAATNDQIHNSTLMQTAIRLFQYIPLLIRTAKINAMPLVNSVGLISVAMRFGATARNASACQHRYPECPDDPEERVHYLNNYNGGLFRFFRGNDQHQYTATEFHDQMLQLGLKPQPTNTYGLYQPQYGPSGQQLASPYPLYNGFQNPGSYPQQYGLRQQNFRTNSQNPYGLYQNQIGNQFYQPSAGQVNSNQQSSSAYGSAYPYYGAKNRRFNSEKTSFKSSIKDTVETNNHIQRRIQNKPEVFTDDSNYAESAWTFPKLESSVLNIHNDFNHVRGGRQLKFPDKENGQETVKQGKGFSFPGAHTNRQYTEIVSHILADDDLYNNRYADAAEGLRNAVDDEEFEVVYVVRGNTDPRQPEIVRIRPGQKI